MLAITPPLAFAVIIYCNDIVLTSAPFSGYSEALWLCLLHFHYFFKLHSDNFNTQPLFECSLPRSHLYNYIYNPACNAIYCVLLNTFTIYTV